MKIELKKLLNNSSIMNDFLDPMDPEELELIRQQSDAPTLIFMFILAMVFMVTMCFEEMAKNRY